MSDKEKHERTGSSDDGENKVEQPRPVFDAGERNEDARSGEAKKHTEATMPPGEGRDPKRNSM